MSDLLRVERVSFSYPSRVILNSVSFAANPGELIALMGCNGAGKSTLLDLISGFRQPAAGQIFFEGDALPTWAPERLARKVSHLPQAVRADLSFTVEQLVAMGRYPHAEKWFESAEDQRAVELAMRRTFCWNERGRRFSSLSGGERQRVLLAACLAQEAAVFLLDEPSTFLDVAQQLHCFDLLREEAAAGKLCIAVTHDLNLALTYCTRLILISETAIVMDAATGEAQQSPDWLRFFSPRLRMGQTPDGGPWVWYR